MIDCYSNLLEHCSDSKYCFISLAKEKVLRLLYFFKYLIQVFILRFFLYLFSDKI